MRFLNHLTNRISKHDFPQHSPHRQRCSSHNLCKLLHGQSNSNGNIYSKIGVPRAPGGPIFGSLVRNSYFSTSSKNQKRGFLSWYLLMLESRPILTKCVSSSIIYAAADVTSQIITMPPSGSVDLIRTSRMAAYGLFILGTAQHNWFNFVARVLPKRDVGTTLKKLAMGQLVFGPLVTSCFFSFNAALQGESTGEIAARLERDLLPTMLNGLMFWPLCDFFTYKVIPVHLQPLTNSSFSYLWTIYLTYMASLKKAAADE